LGWGFRAVTISLALEPAKVVSLLDPGNEEKLIFGDSREYKTLVGKAPRLASRDATAALTHRFHLKRSIMTSESLTLLKRLLVVIILSLGLMAWLTSLLTLSVAQTTPEREIEDKIPKHVPIKS
jgi:hypothetical protein